MQTLYSITLKKQDGVDYPVPVLERELTMKETEPPVQNKQTEFSVFLYKEGGYPLYTYFFHTESFKGRDFVTHLLETKNLSVSFGEHHVIKDVN